MPHGTPEKRREYQRRYREAHREERLEYDRRYNEEHREELAARQRRWREEHPEQLREQERNRKRSPGANVARLRKWISEHPEAHAEAQKRLAARRTQLNRVVVFAYYGEACACCGATRKLEIDHVNGDGREHRRSLNMVGGDRFYRWLIANGLPGGFQTLCRPCNRSKADGSACQLTH